MAKMRLKKGDEVVAIAGEDAASGKSGKILQVLPEKQAAIVEGLNYVKKHMRKTQDNPQGGIVDMEAPIHISNLRRVDEGKAGRKGGRKGGAAAAESS